MNERCTTTKNPKNTCGYRLQPHCGYCLQQEHSNSGWVSCVVQSYWPFERSGIICNRQGEQSRGAMGSCEGFVSVYDRSYGVRSVVRCTIGRIGHTVTVSLVGLRQTRPYIGCVREDGKKSEPQECAERHRFLSCGRGGMLLTSFSVRISFGCADSV